MTRTGFGASRLAALTVAGLAAGGLFLGACSSNSSGGSGGSGGSSTTTSPAATGTSGSASSTTSAGSSGSGGGSTAKLSQIESAVGKESNATFDATYTTQGTGSVSKVTIAQAPPNQAFIVTGSSSGSSGKVITTGGKTYFCGGSGGTSTCISTSSTTNPLAGVITGYSAGAALTAMKSWSTQLAAGIHGYHLTFTTETIAGQSSQCANWSYKGTAAKYCVTDSGVLAYASATTGGSTHAFALTSYSTSPPASLFTVPKTTTTLPGGVTIPSIP